MQLSVQDAEAAGSDAIAGARVFERKLAFARAVRARGLPLTLNVVLHRRNLGARAASSIALARELGADRLELANAQYHGWALANRAALLPTRDALDAAARAVAEARARVAAARDPVRAARLLRASGRSPAWAAGGGSTLVVTPDGRVLPCHGAAELPLEFWYVRERSLRECWGDAPGMNAYRGEAWMREPCRSCPERARDFGGCRCQAFALAGDAAADRPGVRALAAPRGARRGARRERRRARRRPSRGGARIERGRARTIRGVGADPRRHLACLLGEAVRYDGGHKRDRYLTDVLGRYVEWVPVCPEVEVGHGHAARDDPARARRAERVRLVDAEGGRDWTRAMRRCAARRVARARGAGPLRLRAEEGLAELRHGARQGVPGRRRHAGADAARALRRGAACARFPLLPVEEEGRLHDARLRENLIERVFAYRRLRTLFAGRAGPAASSSPSTPRTSSSSSRTPPTRLPRARPARRRREGRTRAELRARYEAAFMAALAVPATPRRHANVLQHALGYLRGTLDARRRARALGGIEDYARGLVPLVVPLTLLRHHVRRARRRLPAGQIYLDPHPKELMLRNQV